MNLMKMNKRIFSERSENIKSRTDPGQRTEIEGEGGVGKRCIEIKERRGGKRTGLRHKNKGGGSWACLQNLIPGSATAQTVQSPA